MDKFEKINALLEEHDIFIRELNNEIDKLKADDVYIQNQALQTQLTSVTQRLQQNEESLATLKAENIRLKNELYEQLFNEKTKLINISDDRLNAYFSAVSQIEKNRLTQFELYIANETDQMIKYLQQYNVNEENTVYQSLHELKERVGSIVSTAYQETARMQAEILSKKSEGLNSLRQEPLTDEQIAKRAKQNNLESFLGLKILNKLGILLIIVGVIAAVQFTYAYIPDTLKGVLAYLLGVAMLVSGELLNRKRPDVFSLGLTSGGIAILYSATALSFFFLHILSMYPALMLCVLITIVAFILSQRYDSQTIATFAIVGGYLPILSISGNILLVYYAIGYFLLLNAFSLLVSVYKKWHISQFAGFAMNVGSIIYILPLLSSSQADGAKYFAIIYAFWGFAVYNALPVISSYRTGTKLTRSDNVLLILNTVIGAAVMFLVFGIFGLWNRTGVLAILLSAVYLATARIVQIKLKEETTGQILFYITGLTYAVLAIPLQFDFAYLTLGWLIEGALLLSYGIWSEKRIFHRAGIVISALCLLSFITFDVLFKGPLFLYKYLFITLASALVLSTLIFKKKALTGPGLIYKCVTVVNVWWFMLYVISEHLYYGLVAATGDFWLGGYLMGIIATVVSLCYAYIIARLKFIADNAVRVISIALYALSVLNTLLMNSGNAYIYTSEYPMALMVIGTTAIVVINLLAVFAVRDLILRLTLGKKLGVEWYPLMLSAFFVFALLQNLITVFDLSLNSVLITTILAATALGWITFGFAKRYQYIRLFGLGISFLTVIKLFVIDLNFLSAGMRIVSYFMLGIALLAISFVYQHFNKKLDAPKGGEQA